MKIKRWMIITGAVAIVAILALIIINPFKKQDAQSLFQTEKIEKGELTALVGATGKVRANQSATLVWQTSGIVDKVKVKVGDKVDKDDILATLRKSSLPQNIIMAESDLVTAQRNLDNLFKSKTEQAEAQLALSNADKELDDAKKNRESLDYPRGTPDRVKIAQDDYDLAQEQFDKAEADYAGVQFKTFDDPERVLYYNAYQNARNKRDSTLRTLQWFTGKPDHFEVAQRDSELAVAQAKYDDASREWNRLKDGPTEDDIAAAQAKVDSIKATLNYINISAPFDSTVTEASVLPGDVVTSGKAGFRVDDLSRLLVDVDITEVDINRVKVGQETTLIFDAIPNKEYKGKVTEVGQVGTEDQGVVNFTVTIELTNGDGVVKPGMTAGVNITSIHLTDVLLIPNRALRVQGGDRVIYILKDGRPQVVKVKIGATADTVSELVGGDAKAGDEVILNPPANLQGFGGGGSGMRMQ